MQIFTYRTVGELAEAIRKEVLTEDRRESEKILIVPTKADMDKLKDILLESGGMGLTFPAIWRWGDLFREIKNNTPVTPFHRVQIDPPDHWLIVRYILDNILEEKDLFPSLPGTRQKGFTSRLGDSLRELMREEVDPGALVKALECSPCNGEGACLHPCEPEGVLCRAYHLYTSYLEENSLCDSAQIASLTRKIMEAHPDTCEWIRKRSFIFTGFLSFNHSQLKLVRTLAQKAGDVSVYTPLTGIPGAYTVLSQFQGTGTISLNRSPLSEAMHIRGGDRRLEIETIARELILWNNNEGDIERYCGKPFPGWGNVSMNCPGDYTHTVEEIFTKYRIPFAVKGGTTVSRTPLWELAGRTWDCFQDDWPSDKTARLLMEPYFMGSLFPVERYEKALPSGRKEWQRLLSYSEDTRLKNIFDVLHDFCIAIFNGGTASELLEALRDLFINSGSEKRISHYVMGVPGLDENCRKMNAAIRETEEKISSVRELLKNIGPAGSRKIQGGKAFEFLKRWAETSTIWNAPSTDNSVDVYPGTPPVLSSNTVWIFSGISSGNWPGNLRETPLLPDSRKERLHSGLELGTGHLPLLSELRKQREYLFRRIIACGEDLSLLTGPDSDASGRPLSSSPFIENSLEDGSNGWVCHPAGRKDIIQRGLNRILPHHEEMIIDGVETREHTTSPERLKNRILPSARIRKGRAPISVSLSALDDWISCPFFYYCRHILGIEERISSGFDSRKTGICLHRIWEKSWQSYVRDGGSLTTLSRTLMETTLKEHYPELLTDMSLKRHLARFRILVSKGGELQDLMEQRSIRSTREGPLIEGYLPELEIDGVTFRGRFDRLDILNHGNAVIIDHKSGKSSGYRNSMQLAAYCLVMDKGSGGKDLIPWKLSGYGYLCHSDRKVTGSASDGKTAEYLGISQRTLNLKEKMKTAEEYMTRMAHDLRQGEFLPEYESEYCGFCPYSGICRRQEKPEGDNRNEQN